MILQREEIREAIREARDVAREAVREAMHEREMAGGFVQGGPFGELPWPPEFQLAVAIVAMICIMIVLVSIGVPIAKAIARRLDRASQSPQLTAPLDSRFDQLERAMEAVAIEVERISEAQRYSARLLTDRLPGPVGQPRDDR